MTPTPKQALEPCPFCGGAPKFCPDDSYGHCGIGCRCEAEPFVQARKDEPEKAFAAWNQRHRQSSNAASVGELIAAATDVCGYGQASRRSVARLRQALASLSTPTAEPTGDAGEGE
ncbi:Lar family restriction alleviation protein [Sphingopyxis macrogoltabida]|uniref:Lar family restriction alleviation protein n=1 Tax=Sphingopyxis macrogoltabida TaxID=33050 RepID=UPI0006ECDC98|nr:Lar family restriction alleviation protein [Sphingopyxis macrogoltabida]ALJ12583.1 hypothetical protein LH19_06865 [Sphingopyxis macrogoltabida]